MCYDNQSLDSIIKYAKKLKGFSLREKCDLENYKLQNMGKGSFGQIIEKFYFQYDVNSNPIPDFNSVGLELKTSPLKTLKNGNIKSKERIVLNIINYEKVYKERFKNSSFWKKNNHLLLVFYLYNKTQNVLDYKIKIVDDWRYSEDDLKIIKNDWKIIVKKIKQGKAHELSEGDTNYLGACTKGQTNKSIRNQPFNEIKAKQRAYCLKQGYVNFIIDKLTKKENKYEKILSTKNLNITKRLDLFDVVESCFKRFYNKTCKEIEDILNINLNWKAKNYYANLCKCILNINIHKRIEEFEKANIYMKTIVLQENNLPKESLSFPSFKFTNIYATTWDKSELLTYIERKFLFVFLKIKNNEKFLVKIKFWNMSYNDKLEVKKVWCITKNLIEKGKIIKEITPKGIVKNHFPKKTENSICHVRPHGRNKNDVYTLPVKDKLTSTKKFTKQCFWLNNDYIKQIFLEKNN